jgi:ATP-binding cassette subfamily G (WHITE) protein 2 (SNQ2)
MRQSSQAQRDAGIRLKTAGVTWRDLRVIAPGGMKIHLRTFPDAIKEALLTPLLLIGPKFGLFAPTPKPILQGFNGVARPGEMILVLGRPGSGCSTFLKTIANQREGYLAVDGDVTYAGIEASAFKKRFAGEVVYNSEDDMHYA